jgi:hypothetical protein
VAKKPTKQRPQTQKGKLAVTAKLSFLPAVSNKTSRLLSKYNIKIIHKKKSCIIDNDPVLEKPHYYNKAFHVVLTVVTKAP